MPPLLAVYIITGIISIAIAFLLTRLAKLSSQTAIKAEKKEKDMECLSSNNFAAKESLRHTILEQIGDYTGSYQAGERLSEKISDIFNEELQKRISLNSQELSQKYETIVKEKKENEEIAWKEYKKAMSDKKETEAVVRSIAEGLVVVDAKGAVLMMNPAAERLLGASIKDKTGKSITENLKDEQLISLIKNSQNNADREIELASQNNETKKIVRASSAVIEDENGKTVGMVSVLSDITKQKELDRLKSNFVSNVTHELRTPLVVTQKAVALLLTKNAGNISEAQENFLTLADRNLKRLSILIDDLLDLAKMEAGKMKFRREISSIDQIIGNAVKDLETWAKTKSISIETRIQEGLPQANVDSQRITQVLTNLIGNSIKFTPENGNICAEAIFRKNNNEIEISIQDTGIGISKEYLTKVFDKFFQAGERISADISGTGIGLSVTKEIVELHGGRIWAESEKGHGARFIFTIPVLTDSANNGGKL